MSAWKVRDFGSCLASLGQICGYSRPFGRISLHGRFLPARLPFYASFMLLYGRYHYRVKTILGISKRQELRLEIQVLIYTSYLEARHD